MTGVGRFRPDGFRAAWMKSGHSPNSASRQLPTPKPTILSGTGDDGTYPKGDLPSQPRPSG